MLVRDDPSTTERVLLHGVSWSTYEALLAEVENRRIRLTYDEGDLEIMTVSYDHERMKTKVGRLIETLTETLDIPIASGGETTLKRALKKKGLEPDECYWVANEPKVRALKRLVLGRHPPPDLVVEVEVSRSALDRMGIYRSLGVPEVWRWTEGRLVFHVLDGEEYLGVATSRTFPFLRSADLTRFLKRVGRTDETTWIRAFRAWVETHLSRKVKKPRKP